VKVGRAVQIDGSRVAARFSYALFALFFVWLVGCDPPGKPKPIERPVPPQDVTDFGILFKQNCAGCHGAGGELGPAPPLHDPLFRAIVPEGELQRVVVDGRSGTQMPAFARANGGALTPTQIQILVSQIKGVPYKVGDDGPGHPKKVIKTSAADGIAPSWGVPKPAAQQTPSYLLGESAVARTPAECETIRKTIFARACADCHGDNGQGGSSGGPINDRAFLALTSNQALRRLIITGRPDLGMPDYATGDGRSPDFKTLTAKDVGDLVALLAFWRAGESATGESQAQTDKR
jgi:cytochrome c oxidase cbb3-type subunit III